LRFLLQDCFGVCSMYFSHQCFYLKFLACEEPPPRRVKEVPTKRWNNPPYPHGTQATYNCRPGYIKIGRVAFRCVDGTWKQLDPVTECRNKPCGHPGDTEFGFFELTNGSEFVFGARVEYRCNDGYQMLSQRNYRECQADGWSNDIPHCEVIKCLPVQEPENGRIIMTGAFELGQEYSFGQVVNFECNAKHKLVGAKEIVCSANGEWSNDVPQCKEIICDVPEIPHGYVRSPRKSYKENELMQFSCKEGYKYGNKADALCTESGWNPPPSCIEIVCSPPVISSGNFKPRKDKYTAGNKITVECDEGYHFKVTTGSTTAECTRNGWAPDPACVRKPCDVPRIENGRLSGSNYYYNYFPKSFGQTVYYQCLNGYLSPTGDDWVLITCSERGWFPEPKCLKKCFVRELVNGYFPYRGWYDYVKEGERATYVCYDGYQAQHPEVTCTSNGWAPPPRCTHKKKCQDITFKNGYLTLDRRTFNLEETIPYKCHTGFVTPEGQETGHTQCKESGWTPPPKCIKSCKPPGDILIHHTNKTVFMPEDTIEYSCLEGYKTKNNMPTDTTMCGKNGEWTPEPQCHEIKCALLPFSNGDFSPKEGKYHSGAVVKFTCAKNYIRVGAASIQCYHFGWFPSPPVCQVSVEGCGPPPEIPSGSIVDGSVEQYQHGDTKQYECNGEFKLVGSKEIECIDGQWSSPPSCIEDKMPCDSPSSIPNVVLHQADQAQYSHGDEVTCGCKPGSDNTKEMKIKCLHGEWKPLPVCADASPQCVIPEDVVLVRSGQYPMSRRRTGFHKVIHYTCTLADENVKQATCVSGRWTPEIACTGESVCPPPPQVPGAQQTTAGRNFRNGSKASFSCADGFQLVGKGNTKEIICTEGKWQSPPHCVERPCLPPPSVECADAPRLQNPNLKIEREGKTIYLAGAGFKYVSRSGYMLNGSTEINCSMGKWTEAPSCLEMPCGSVPKVANAEFEGRKKNSYEPGETVRYQCDSGFLIVGSPEIICRKGNWTAPPFCEDISCGAVPEIPNARVAGAPQPRYLPGARVHYQCESNFQITGANYVFCSNGQWSQPPVCRDVRCDPPEEIAGGTIEGIRKSKYMPGESAKYQCWKNFKMTGTSTVVCKNGTWTELPTCKGNFSLCGTPPAIQSGELLVFPLQEYKEGDTLEYQCPNFYILEGSPTITCRNGQWTKPPVCLVACTASEEDMTTNNIELKWRAQNKLYSTSGDHIEFRCKLGYLKDPSTPNFRVQCVEGTLEYPRCTPGRSCFLDRDTMEKNNIQLQSSSRSRSHYLSGESVLFECKWWYRRVSRKEEFRAECLDGVIPYPVCQCKCL
ncbi:CFAH factor, partial [Prunella himalayana]|nr:CFAH factor [Prunella himalayana]